MTKYMRKKRMVTLTTADSRSWRWGARARDVHGLEEGVGVGGDDAAMGKLLAHEDGAEGGGKRASQIVLFA